jgi:hypothetical protein
MPTRNATCTHNNHQKKEKRKKETIKKTIKRGYNSNLFLPLVFFSTIGFSEASSLERENLLTLTFIDELQCST